MSIDFSRPVQTRDGREVRIFTTESRDPSWPVVGEVSDYVRRCFAVKVWTKEGFYTESSAHHPCDLVNVPQKHVRWINFWDTEDVSSIRFKTKEEADRKAKEIEPRHKRIACIKIEFEEGEGLT